MSADLADRLAAEDAASLRSFGGRAPGRFVAEVAGLTVVYLGVDEPWGLQIAATSDPPDAAAVDAAVAWCRERQREPLVRVRERDRGVLPGYSVVEVLPALVASAIGSQDVLTVAPATDLEEFRHVYATAFAMSADVAAGLVVAADLEAHPHLVGRAAGRPVACAQVRPGAGLAYVNGVGVLPQERGRGFGEAMMTACAAVAGRLGCELVWLHASEVSVGFYEAIGYELVDTHLALAAS